MKKVALTLCVVVVGTLAALIVFALRSLPDVQVVAIVGLCSACAYLASDAGEED